MAEADGIPPTASVVVPGLSLNYIGQWAYAYSGTINVTGTPVNLLNFTTGAGVIVGKIKTVQATAAAENDDVLASLLFNGLYIFRITLGKNSFNEHDPGAVTETDIIIPPFTLVQVELDNLSGGSADMSSLITGRVYDV